MVAARIASVDSYYPQRIKAELSHDSEPCTPTQPPLKQEWLEPKRMAAVDTILECNDTSDPTINAMLKLLRGLTKVHTVCLSMIKDDCVSLKQSYGTVSKGCSFEAPGLCFWSLVPEQPQVIVVEDTLLDARTSTSPLVTQAPFVRFYAAAPLVTCNKQLIGNLCLFHDQPVQFCTADAAVLSNFAELIMRVLEAYVLLKQPSNPILSGEQRHGKDAYSRPYAIVDIGVPGWRVLHANAPFDKLTGRNQRGIACTTGCEEQEFFWDIFSASDVGTEDEVAALCLELRASKQPLTLRKVPISGQDGPLYAMLRPATAQMVDEYALVVGNPSRQDSSESSEETLVIEESPDGHSAECYDNLYFVLLVHEWVEQPSEFPIPNLRLGSALGAGAYARVFRGLYKASKVAVKVVHDWDTSMEENGLPLEVTIMQEISHANIVQLRDYRLQLTGPGCQPRLWLILEYCQGGTLADAVDKGYFRETPSQAALPCMRTILITAKELALALSHLHSRGSLHCDISGGNVLLTSTQANPHGFMVKLADFGLSRRQDVAYPLKSIEGTRSYLAPEVLRGEAQSQASDVYSFGVILYEMICGKKAWAALNAFRITYAIIFNGEALKVPERTPPGVKTIVNSCLDHQASIRPSMDKIIGLINEQLAIFG